MNPAIADLAGPTSNPLRYENLSTFDRLSFRCMAFSKESQNSCHSSNFPTNLRTSSLGSFTRAVFEFAEVPGEAAFSVRFEFSGFEAGAEIMAEGSTFKAVSFSSMVTNLCVVSAFRLAALLISSATSSSVDSSFATNSAKIASSNGKIFSNCSFMVAFHVTSLAFPVSTFSNPASIS